MKSPKHHARVLATIGLFGALLSLPTGVVADVKPGDKITKANADAVKDLVSPGVLWCVKKGLPLNIVE